MKMPVLLLLAWTAQQSEAREVFQIAPLAARTQTERAAMACVGNRFRLLTVDKQYLSGLDCLSDSVV
jgi:hypothetical protein